MRFLDIQDILEQERVVEAETKSRLAGFYVKSLEGIDLLIHLIYSIPSRPIEETPGYQYFSYVHAWFYMAVFTLRACVLLLSRGYYFEASLLNRNLIEVLVKIRYFSNHKEDLGKFENIDALKRGYPKMNFRQMFDEVLPGYYQEYRMSSHMAHGGIGARLMKIKYHSATSADADTGVFYNEWRAGHTVNVFVVYFLGYIRFYKKLFPEVVTKLPSDVRDKLAEIEAWYERNIQQHIKLKGGENSWHRAVRPIWDI